MEEDPLNQPGSSRKGVSKTGVCLGLGVCVTVNEAQVVLRGVPFNVQFTCSQLGVRSARHVLQLPSSVVRRSSPARSGRLLPRYLSSNRSMHTLTQCLRGLRGSTGFQVRLNQTLGLHVDVVIYARLPLFSKLKKVRLYQHPPLLHVFLQLSGEVLNSLSEVSRQCHLPYSTYFPFGFSSITCRQTM